MSDVTQLLNAIDAGDRQAAEDLLPLVYDELRKLAAARLAHEQPGQTLQPTALVHVAWLRLAGSNHRWNGRSHFFDPAAEAIRRILIDQARREAAHKRGSGASVDKLHESQIELKVPAEEILAVNDALDLMAAEDALAAQVVKLRYFVGMTNLEIAEALNGSERVGSWY